MKVRRTLKTFLTLYVALASPFFLLTLINQFLPINLEILVYGNLFSLLTSAYFVFSLREKRTLLAFEDRDQFIRQLTPHLQNLGYAEKNRKALLTTFEPLEAYLLEREISVYIFKNSAMIIAPHRFSKYLQIDRHSWTNRTSKRGATLFGSASSSNPTNHPTCKP